MSILPEKAHFVAAQIEDRLTIWRDRTADPHPSVVQAGMEVTDLCGEMIEIFSDLMASINTELTGSHPPSATEG
jgi:hypothetical protein